MAFDLPAGIDPSLGEALISAPTSLAWPADSDRHLDDPELSPELFAGLRAFAADRADQAGCGCGSACAPPGSRRRGSTIRGARRPPSRARAARCPPCPPCCRPGTVTRAISLVPCASALHNPSMLAENSNLPALSVRPVSSGWLGRPGAKTRTSASAIGLPSDVRNCTVTVCRANKSTAAAGPTADSDHTARGGPPRGRLGQGGKRGHSASGRQR